MTDEDAQYTDEHAAAGVHAPLPEIETWPNQYPGYEIEIVAAGVHFGLSRRPGLPDHGELTLRYVPDKLCLELKSLKMYMLAYRNLGIFQENVVNRFLRDVVKACQPVEATVIGRVHAARRRVTPRSQRVGSKPGKAAWTQRVKN